MVLSKNSPVYLITGRTTAREAIINSILAANIARGRADNHSLFRLLLVVRLLVFRFLLLRLSLLAGRHLAVRDLR